MKQNFKYALMGAIALTGASFFSACSSSEETIDNPDYNPETKSVKTAITLSIDPNGSAVTRMAAGTAQVASAFRGIQDIWLIPSTAAISGTTSTTTKIELGSLTVFDSNTESQKTYTDKEVPVNTTNFLFLGKAAHGDVTTSANRLANGYTTNNIGAGNDFAANTVGDISINAVGIAPITEGETPTLTEAWTVPASNLATYLTNIAKATGWATTENANLRNIRNSFISNGLRAGSSAAILLTLQSLYNAVNGIDPTVSGAIQTAITAANLQVTSAANVTPITLGWVSSPTVLTNFPVNLGLPEGAAQYQWDATNNQFEYVAGPTLNAANTAVMNLVYPNELYYLTSTTLKETSNKVVTWPASVNAWTNEGWSGWTATVQPTSKNIALFNNIQYGTALLATTVKVEAATLYDNAKALDPDKKGDANATNNAITVNSTSFPLTGVLVGGQPASVGWNFTPSGTDFNKVVYDSNVSGIYAASTTASDKNYTLVFDNLASSEQSDVNVCLEFSNDSGSDFYGKDGLILKNQKFYIVGKLKLSGKSFPFPVVGVETTTADNIAAKTASYYPSTTLRVFIQDFETIANFVLTAGSGTDPGSLGKAFATIPDLRSTNQTLGLSVDLAWRPGLTYSVNLGAE